MRTTNSIIFSIYFLVTLDPFFQHIALNSVTQKLGIYASCTFVEEKSLVHEKNDGTTGECWSSKVVVPGWESLGAVPASSFHPEVIFAEGGSLYFKNKMVARYAAADRAQKIIDIVLVKYGCYKDV